MLDQVRNSRLLSLALGILLCSPRFRFASATGGQPTGLTLISALAALGQVRNSRLLSLPLGILLCSPRFRLAASATGGASAPRPIDVNDVLWAIGQVVKLKSGGVSQMIVRDDGKRIIKRISDMSFARKS